MEEVFSVWVVFEGGGEAPVVTGEWPLPTAVGWMFSVGGSYTGRSVDRVEVRSSTGAVVESNVP